jgi:hypothetical protein
MGLLVQLTNNLSDQLAVKGKVLTSCILFFGVPNQQVQGPALVSLNNLLQDNSIDIILRG